MYPVFTMFCVSPLHTLFTANKLRHQKRLTIMKPSSLAARHNRSLLVSAIRGEIPTTLKSLAAKRIVGNQKAFGVYGAVRQLTKQCTCPVADKNRARCETTNRSIQALIDRPEQANQKVTSRCWFPDESVPHGHLGCNRQMGYATGAVTMVTRRSY